MQRSTWLITLAFCSSLSAAENTDFALFNGLPVDIGNNVNSVEAYERIVTDLERGQPQTLIIEYRDSFQFSGVADWKHNLQQRLISYDQVKVSTFLSFDPSSIKGIRNYSHLPMSVARINNSQGLEQLMRHPQVKAVYEDINNKLFLNQSLPLIQQPPVAVEGGTGAGTAVAVLDTGVDYTHPAFGSCTSPGVPSSCKVAYARDFATDDGGPDVHGHGTNVAGISLGTAPETSILALDVFDGEGAWSSDIIDAINWSIGNQATYNIAAINMSLGAGRYFSECSTDVFATPISAAKAAGILVAVASGNDGYKDSMGSPACVPDAVSVGAVYDSSMGNISWGICSDVTAADLVTCFSDSASFLDLLAPGALITAAGITMGGTSQATPHVAGAAAVLAQVFPEESVDQWLSRLHDTGLQVADDGNNITKPRIDLYAAIHSQASNQLFDDVPPSYWAYDWIETLGNSGITSGCDANNYCPQSPVTRASMAIFLERGIHGSSYIPPTATGTVFSDVSSTYWAASWVEQLSADGITGGCGDGNYCPNSNVTRAQMAIFLLRSEHGASYIPPSATGTMFDDVSASHWAAPWIEQLANEGITSGCDANSYCPEAEVKRDQMAIFLVRAFNL